MKHFLTGLAAALLAVTAHAQGAPNAICTLRAAPRIPAVEWQGEAAYLARAQVRDGRVTAVEITSLTAGVDRRSARALVHAIETALRAATCQPGEHVFQQRFDFTLGHAAARPARPAAAAASAPPLDPAALTPHACHVGDTPIPPAVSASDWRGQAAYLSHAEFRNGRIQRVSITPLRRDVDAPVQRELMAAVRKSMMSAQCPPGDHTLEQRFDFDLRGEPAPAPPD